ncbi:RluA family pseudouridine synthase [Acetobacter estunensis]|uniref:RluA family pseudouridine synthase n=1 Tax=Acetobacter estunensis TaxID=104097 RepID=UPI001C2D8022|nr:RNA pseudouridine synthase [Acetobacter estunensis]MBV1835862.1 RNA pseudouridine synthase [Acetobacter estunensis]MBV1835877.1 RNA pseudouridine synthase [Acetobacter estunensis]
MKPRFPRAQPKERVVPSGAILPFPILFSSPQALVIDKPAGLPVHPGPRDGPSVEDWFPLMSRRRDGPWLAHRLDTDTAGCLAIALRKQTLLAMQTCFASGQARKTYWAVVEGVPDESGEIDQPLRKVSSPTSGWKMELHPSGQAARTSWRRLGTDGHISWLELTLHTGRTHQARVHCAALGTPILGDPVYGTRTPDLSMLHLFSRRLELPLAVPIAATASPPAHMLTALARCGFRETLQPQNGSLLAPS